MMLNDLSVAPLCHAVTFTHTKFSVYFICIYTLHSMLIASCSQHSFDSANEAQLENSATFAKRSSFHCCYVYNNICICGVGFSTTLCHSCCSYIKRQHGSFLFKHFSPLIRNIAKFICKISLYVCASLIFVETQS